MVFQDWPNSGSIPALLQVLETSDDSKLAMLCSWTYPGIQDYLEGLPLGNCPCNADHHQLVPAPVTGRKLPGVTSESQLKAGTLIPKIPDDSQRLSPYFYFPTGEQPKKKKTSTRSDWGIFVSCGGENIFVLRLIRFLGKVMLISFL